MEVSTFETSRVLESAWFWIMCVFLDCVCFKAQTRPGFVLAHDPPVREEGSSAVCVCVRQLSPKLTHTPRRRCSCGRVWVSSHWGSGFGDLAVGCAWFRGLPQTRHWAKCKVEGLERERDLHAVCVMVQAHVCVSQSSVCCKHTGTKIWFMSGGMGRGGGRRTGGGGRGEYKSACLLVLKPSQHSARCILGSERLTMQVRVSGCVVGRADGRR